MDSLSDTSEFAPTLLDWYEIHQRKLPWRANPEPYHVWLSEIILQQTRVDQGLPYYHNILRHYPNIQILAHAPLDELLVLWQGLGYYSRAKNMHKAAQQVVNEFDGCFPNTYDKLLTLSGVGEYTAAAIASISFGEAQAVVDGNVYRVLSRYFAIEVPINSSKGKNEFKKLAQALLDTKQPSKFNQAMMEFGALQCTPNRPDCQACPLLVSCEAFRTKRIQELPVKIKSKPKKQRFLLYLFLKQGENTWIKQRLDRDIWQNLWEFPLLEFDKPFHLETILQEKILENHLKTSFFIKTPLLFTHTLSHQQIHAMFLPLVLTDPLYHQPEYKAVAMEDLSNFALPKLLINFLDEYGK